MQVATSWPRAVGQHCRGRRRGVAAAAAGQVTPEAALAYLESQPASGQLVRCALEWATIQALHKRKAVAPTSNVTQHLAGHLGDDLLAIVEQHCVQGMPLYLLSPASLLLPLCPSSVVEHNSLASTAVRLLRSRLSWRRIALRQLNVCVTWGGAVTDVSTANTAGPCLELPLALALPDAGFEQHLCAMGVPDVAAQCRLALQAHAGQAHWAGSGPAGGHTMPHPGVHTGCCPVSLAARLPPGCPRTHVVSRLHACDGAWGHAWRRAGEGGTPWWLSTQPGHLARTPFPSAVVLLPAGRAVLHDPWCGAGEVRTPRRGASARVPRGQRTVVTWSTYYNASTTNSMVGMPLVPQVGWGGGPNVTLGPPSGNVVYGVHVTPATAVTTPAGTTAVLLTYQVGTYKSASTGAPTQASLGALVNTVSPGAFVPSGVTVTQALTVTGGAATVSTTPSTCIQYLRTYQTWPAANDVNGVAGPAGSGAPTCIAANVTATGSAPAQGTTQAVTVNNAYYGSGTVFPGASGACYLNASSSACAACAVAANANTGYWYLSPLICHTYITGLAPAALYSYSITATVANTNAANTAVPAGSYAMPANTVNSTATTWSFTAPAAPSAAGAPSPSYPLAWVLMADVGQTYNSSLTAQYVARYSNMVGGLDNILNVGDFTYGDDFGPTTTYYAAPSTGGSNVIKWDSWAAMWQPVTGLATLVNAPGNHEMETLSGYPYNGIKYTDGPTTLGANVTSASDGRNMHTQFQGYSARFPNGAMAASQIGDLWNAQYYAQAVGPVFVIAINNFLPFHVGTAQYTYILNALQTVNRVATPWLIVTFHSPPYHTYYTHYKEMECFLSIYEPLFLQYRVDFVVNGHVHAYERTHPMYNYALHPFGPVYITVGDGGNIEGPYRSFVDDVYSPGVTFCQQKWAAANFTAGFVTCPSYQQTQQPPSCNAQSFQPANGILGQPGVVASPFAAGQFWCQSSQPVWSAHRDPSFGFSGLTFVNDTYATYSWYRNIDQSSTGTGLVSADTAVFIRNTAVASPPPPPPSPLPPAGAPVAGSMQLAGVTLTQWTPAIQTGFISVLASQLGVQAAAITVTSVTSSSGAGRHLLQGGVTIAFTVLPQGTASFNTVQVIQALQAVSTPAGAAALVAALNASPSFAGITVSGASTGYGTPAAPGKQTPWAAHRKISIGLGVGLGLGIGLPLIVCVVYCCRPKKEAAAADKAALVEA